MQAGLISKLKEKGFEVIDHGDISRPRVDGNINKKNIKRFDYTVYLCNMDFFINKKYRVLKIIDQNFVAFLK